MRYALGGEYCPGVRFEVGTLCIPTNCAILVCLGAETLNALILTIGAASIALREPKKL